eukprot:scaffold18957_cov139-Isochrysis_galbana.AAC.3
MGAGFWCDASELCRLEPPQPGDPDPQQKREGEEEPASQRRRAQALAAASIHSYSKRQEKNKDIKHRTRASEPTHDSPLAASSRTTQLQLYKDKAGLKSSYSKSSTLANGVATKPQATLPLRMHCFKRIVFVYSNSNMRHTVQRCTKYCHTRHGAA